MIVDPIFLIENHISGTKDIGAIIERGSGVHFRNRGQYETVLASLYPSAPSAETKRRSVNKVSRTVAFANTEETSMDRIPIEDSWNGMAFSPPTAGGILRDFTENNGRTNPDVFQHINLNEPMSQADYLNEPVPRREPEDREGNENRGAEDEDFWRSIRDQAREQLGINEGNPRPTVETLRPLAREVEEATPLRIRDIRNVDRSIFDELVTLTANAVQTEPYTYMRVNDGELRYNTVANPADLPIGTVLDATPDENNQIRVDVNFENLIMQEDLGNFPEPIRARIRDRLREEVEGDTEAPL